MDERDRGRVGRLVRRVGVVVVASGIGVSLFAAGGSALGQPEDRSRSRSGQDGSGPPGREVRIDPNTDAVLVRLKSELSLDDATFGRVRDRYVKLRQEEQAIVREVMGPARAKRGAEDREEGQQNGPRGGPPGGANRMTLEDRVKYEDQIEAKASPLVKAFVTDVRAMVPEGQRAKFDALVPELNLSPQMGPPQRAAGTFDLKNSVKIETRSTYRLIESNGIPDHAPGQFPGPGNPNSISEQRYSFHVPLSPKVAGGPSPQRGTLAGVALNGVPFDPGTAEVWRNDPSLGWHGEAISPLTKGGKRMGLDASNAHVQPNGAYHYHAMPVGVVKRVASEKGVKVGEAMILIGWAADGYPIYDNHGYSKADDAKSPVKELHSSYKLRKGERPGESSTPPGPGGAFDGSYTADFEYVAGSGDLDECNGRTGVTPEFPNGTYYYVITGEFPYISRMFHGVPDRSFMTKGPGGPGGPRGGRGGSGGE